MLEASIEKYLDDAVTARGGFTVKLNPKGYRGIPDRLVVLPGRIMLVELKRPKGGVIASLQYWWRVRFIELDLGHAHAFARTKEEVDEVLGRE